MSQVSHADPFVQARARWLAAQARGKSAASPPQPTPSDALPEALRADIAALRAVGLDVHVRLESPLPGTQPARVLAWADVERLDARDPRRTLYQYQRAYASLDQTVPAAIVENLRAAARDDHRRRVSLPRE
jgi:hypothetical protein